jgi:hypothetical protein
MGSYWRSREGGLRTSGRIIEGDDRRVPGSDLGRFERGTIWIDGKGLDPCETNPGGTFGTRRLRTGLAPPKFLDVM